MLSDSHSVSRGVSHSHPCILKSPLVSVLHSHSHSHCLLIYAGQNRRILLAALMAISFRTHLWRACIGLL